MNVKGLYLDSLPLQMSVVFLCHNSCPVLAMSCNVQARTILFSEFRMEVNKNPANIPKVISCKVMIVEAAWATALRKPYCDILKSK